MIQNRNNVPLEELGQWIEDGETVDLFVVSGLDVPAFEKLEDRVAQPEEVSVGEPGLSQNLFVVQVGAVAAATVRDDVVAVSLEEPGVASRDAGHLEDDGALFVASDGELAENRIDAAQMATANLNQRRDRARRNRSSPSRRRRALVGGHDEILAEPGTGGASAQL